LSELDPTLMILKYIKKNEVIYFEESCNIHSETKDYNSKEPRFVNFTDRNLKLSMERNGLNLVLPKNVYSRRQKEKNAFKIMKMLDG